MSEDTRSLLKRFVRYYRPQYPLLALDIVTGALRAAFTITIPYIVVLTTIFTD